MHEVRSIRTKIACQKRETSCQQQKSPRGGLSFYVDKRFTFEKTCYTSAAKWELRGIGASTIIYCKETITFNNTTGKRNVFKLNRCLYIWNICGYVFIYVNTF